MFGFRFSPVHSAIDADECLTRHNESMHFVVESGWTGSGKSTLANGLAAECLCSDVAIHRERIEGRQRNIPGWYELRWEQVERARTLYPPLSGPKLVLDAVASSVVNRDLAREYLNRPVSSVNI